MKSTGKTYIKVETTKFKERNNSPQKLNDGDKKKIKSH